MISLAMRAVDDCPRFATYGRVVRIVGLVIEAVGLELGLGELCRITSLSGERSVLGEVVGFHERGILLMPLGELEGLHPGCSVYPVARLSGVEVGPGMLGRILDGLGRPIDGKGKLDVCDRVPLSCDPPNPLDRRLVDQPLETGVRAIDGLLTMGRGQRMGIFSGSGVGKSTLLGMIARRAKADVNVIALLGERGREVRDFIERSLGPEGLARSVVVVATGDQAALVRARGALVATAIAEYFRDQGQHVLLMVDSITRVAMAWREIGLAVGEPPTTKGYPPSVFAMLPRLLERAGAARVGAISGVYTVLVDGDDFNEPVADAARSILDGHIVLTRKLASWTANTAPRPTSCGVSKRRIGRRKISSSWAHTNAAAIPRSTPPCNFANRFSACSGSVRTTSRHSVRRAPPSWGWPAPPTASTHPRRNREEILPETRARTPYLA